MEKKSRNTTLIVAISVSAIVLVLGIVAAVVCFSKISQMRDAISNETVVESEIFKPEPVEPQYEWDGLEEWLLEGELLGDDYTPNYVLHFVGIGETEYTDGDYKYRVHPECGAFLSEYIGSDTEVSVPDTIGGYTVFGLDNFVFMNNKDITSVTLPKSCVEVGADVFKGCVSLSNINLPSGLKYIGARAFGQCVSLTDIELPYGLSIIGDGAFYKCENLKNINIPITVSKVCESAFGFCTSLEEVVIPDYVITMEEDVFEHCESLKKVVLGEKINSVPQGTFAYCSSLEEVEIKGSISKIGVRAFYKSSIEEIELQSSLREIKDNAFDSCENLKNLVLPEGVEILGESAFAGCRSLETIHFASTVSSIGESCFATCLSLQEITVDPENAYFTAVDGVMYTKDMTILVAYPLARSGEYTVPDGVLAIYNRAFRGAFELNHINLPDGLILIDSYAFQSSGLREITIPASVLLIEEKAFNGCNSLTEVHIKNSEIAIGKNAFLECPALERIYFAGSSSQWDTLMSSLEDTSMFDEVEIIYNA